MRQKLTRYARAGAFCLSLATASSVFAEGISGPYLAATQADIRNDYKAAGRYYAEALAYSPRDPLLLQSAMVAQVAAGQISNGVTLARQMETTGSANQLTALVLLADALAKDEFEQAREIVSDEASDFNPLFRGLMLGWIEVGLGDYDAAQARFDSMDGSPALNLYGQYHKALALALAGDYATADQILKGDADGPLHLNRTAILGHVQILSQLEQPEAALDVIREAVSGGYADERLSQFRTALENGETLDFDVISDAPDGAAEAMLILAAALNREQAQRLGLLYTRLAAHARPQFDEAILLGADILQAQQQHDLAVLEYARIPTDSVWYVTAEIGRADSLDAAERRDEAIEVLNKLSRERPENISVQTGLGDLQRRDEAYAEAAEAYSRALELIKIDTANHWVIYYSRGISFERTDRWDQAESDFRKALELRPDQPLVLNYLGYSLVELHRNLEEAQAMIEKAVQQRPDDGYITDSLGWVLYRLGKYEEAVPHMERAVELLPIDPIINDHLGDVLWKVDRRLEAEFQWRRALSFDPEEADAERIRRKLEIGLDAVLEQEAESVTEELTAQDG